MRKKAYDWVAIQAAYDTGLSYKDLRDKFGVHGATLQSARDRGDFIPRSNNDLRRQNISNLYDWSVLQEEYDNGLPMSGLRTKFGISMASLNRACKLGLFKARSRSDSMKVRLDQGWRPTPPSEVAKAALSLRQTENYRGGFCKWYWVGNQYVQGTWERDAGLKLTELGIEWRKCAGKSDILVYVLDGKTRRYTPDFYLPAYDLFLEFKGYWWGDDRRKMDAVIEQHPDVNIAILEKMEYFNLIENGVI